MNFCYSDIKNHNIELCIKSMPFVMIHINKTKDIKHYENKIIKTINEICPLIIFKKIINQLNYNEINIYKIYKIYNFDYQRLLEKNLKYIEIKISIIIFIACLLFKYMVNSGKNKKKKRIRKFLKIRKTKLTKVYLNDICVICLEYIFSKEKSKLIRTQKITNLECKHIFHESCITEWLKENANCPICRFNIFNDKKDIKF